MLFLSDTEEELDAAAEAGMRTTWVIRPQESTVDVSKIKSQHPIVTSFSEIVV